MAGCLEMSDKKVVSRNVAIGLGALCAILLVALVYSFVNYTTVLRDKDSLIASLNAQIVDLGGQPGQTPSGSDKDALIAALQDEINSLSAAKLVSVNLKAEDNRSVVETPFVHVYGYVVNFGNSTAGDARIHVVLQQSGGVVANDTYIDLGSVGGESVVSVDTKVYYEGSEITLASMVLEWT
jgi:hypothetical protein